MYGVLILSLRALIPPKKGLEIIKFLRIIVFTSLSLTIKKHIIMKTKKYDYKKIDAILTRIDVGFVMIMLTAVVLFLLGSLVWAIFSSEGPIWPVIGFFGLFFGLPFLSYWVGKVVLK